MIVLGFWDSISIFNMSKMIFGLLDAVDDDQYHWVPYIYWRERFLFADAIFSAVSNMLNISLIIVSHIRTCLQDIIDTI
jgi:hypothetical protein